MQHSKKQARSIKFGGNVHVYCIVFAHSAEPSNIKMKHETSASMLMSLEDKQLFDLQWQLGNKNFM